MKNPQRFLLQGLVLYETIRKVKVVVLFAIGLASAFFCSQLQAVPIQGNINFNGVVTLGDQTAANTSSLDLATRVNVWNDSWVSQVSGDFTSITPGFSTKATMAAPWIFNSGTPGTPAPGPMTNSLWNVGGFTFDLTSSAVSSQSSTFLDVTGIGTIRSTNSNFDPTPGTWSYSISNSGGGQQNTFSFQAEAAAVPEPSSVALVAIGAISAAGASARRRLKRA